MDIVPTRISLLANNIRRNTRHAYVQLLYNKKEKRALNIWRKKQDTAVFKLIMQKGRSRQLGGEFFSAKFTIVKVLYISAG
jgi:hypothetical protein